MEKELVKLGDSKKALDEADTIRQNSTLTRVKLAWW